MTQICKACFTFSEPIPDPEFQMGELVLVHRGVTLHKEPIPLVGRITGITYNSRQFVLSEYHLTGRVVGFEYTVEVLPFQAEDTQFEYKLQIVVEPGERGSLEPLPADYEGWY